jgi:hypothetical protein
LQRLWLWDNQLRSLPPEIGNLENLNLLYLGNNHLSHLPPEIGNLRNLRDLYLQSNQLIFLPPEIGNLSNLCWIDLRDNPLQRLPFEFAALEGLLVTNCGFGYGDYLISPPFNVLEAGKTATFDYLRNEAWWHLQRLIAGAAASVGILAVLVLGFHWKNRIGGKKKRED